MADGSRHSLYAVKEGSYGVTPTNPALEFIRILNTTLGLAKESLESGEIRPDRQIADFRLGSNQINGDINFELSYGSFDMFLQTVLMSTDWASPATTGTTTLDATATGFSRAAGDFTADGFAVGQTVTSSGFVGSGYNGKSIISAVDALTMDTTIVGGGTHGVEAGDADELIIASEEIRCGVARDSLTLIRYFEDIQAADKPYYIYRGNEIDSLQLTIAANAMVTGSFKVFGQSLELAQDLSSLGTPTYLPTSTTSPVDSFTGSLTEGGVDIAVVTEITLNLVNGIEPRFVVGQKNSISPTVKRSNLTGQLTAFFEDSSLVEKFINEEDSNLEFSLPDVAGNYQRYRVTRIKYTGGQPDVGGEGPVTLVMPFQALLDPVTGTNLIAERNPI